MKYVCSRIIDIEAVARGHASDSRHQQRRLPDCQQDKCNWIDCTGNWSAPAGHFLSCTMHLDNLSKNDILLATSIKVRVKHFLVFTVGNVLIILGVIIIVTMNVIAIVGVIRVDGLHLDCDSCFPHIRKGCSMLCLISLKCQDLQS